MSEEKKRKNKIIGISIGILVVLLIVISSTYAYWQITRSQDGSNDIIAACLDIDMESVDGTFGINPAWPLSDAEGRKLNGYTFKVTNNCSEDVTYLIGMDSLDVEGAEYLDYDSINVLIDSADIEVYSDNDRIDHIEENDPYTIRTSKKIATTIVKGNTSNEHNVKVWIKSDAPVSEQSKVFRGRIFITGGQKIENDKSLPTPTSDACFEMSGNEIIGYDESCGTSVTIPATVDKVAVKTIDSNAFKASITIYNYDFVAVTDSNGNPQKAYILDSSEMEEIREWGNTYGFEDVEMNPYIGTPEISNGEMILYCNMGDDINNLCELPGENELMYTKTLVSIKELDLSRATNLELIEESAFSNLKRGELSEDILFGELDPSLVSLTSLNFGGNTREIKIGNMAFAGISVSDLTVYTTHTLDIKDEMYEDCNPDGHCIDYFGGYLFSKIDKITIKTANDKTSYGTANYYVEKASSKYHSVSFDDFAYVDISGQLIFDEGITEIVRLGNVEVNNIILPNTLKSIRENAFPTFKSNIIIPLSVMIIEKDAFEYMESINTITMQGRTSLDGMTLGDNWKGSATVVYD